MVRMTLLVSLWRSLETRKRDERDVLTIAVASSYIFANFQMQEKPNESPSSKTIPTFLALYGFGFIYELILVYDALRMKNTIQVIGLCACNLGLLIYGAVQVRQIKDAVSVLADNQMISPIVWAQSQPFLIIIPCIVALGSILMIFVAWKLYDEFAWTIYKHISADLRMKRRYLTYQIYIALLKFDFFFFLGFTVQFLVVVSSSKHDAEFYLTIIAVPVTIIILVFAAWFVRRESTAGMIVIIVSFAKDAPLPPQSRQQNPQLIPSSAALVCGHGLLLLQAFPHVFAPDLCPVPACSAFDDLFRHHHPNFDRHHHHQCMHLHT